jgi:pimeloyl-ACP methyl ester carboxylesterase
MYGEDVVGLVLLDPTVEGWEEYLQTQIPHEAFASILLEDVSHPERWERYDSFEEIRSWYAGDNQPFDDMPITVISRGIPFRDAYLTPEQAVTMLEEWHSYHAMVADQSSRGKLVVAEGAGHFPHFEIPALVISSVYEILELVGETR